MIGDSVKEVMYSCGSVTPKGMANVDVTVLAGE